MRPIASAAMAIIPTLTGWEVADNTNCFHDGLMMAGSSARADDSRTMISQYRARATRGVKDRRQIDRGGVRQAQARGTASMDHDVAGSFEAGSPGTNMASE